MPEQFTPEEMDLLTSLEQTLTDDDTCDNCMSIATWSCPCPNPACPVKPSVVCEGHHQFALLRLRHAFRGEPGTEHYHCVACDFPIGSVAEAISRWQQIA